MGTVQGVCDDADELPGRVQGKLGVAVQGDAVADYWQHFWVAHVEAEARVVAPRSTRLNSSSFPACAPNRSTRPRRGSTAHPMEEVEAVWGDPGRGGRSNPRTPARAASSDLVRLPASSRWGVGEVAEDGEVNARVGVSPAPGPPHAPVIGHPGHVREHGGDDHRSSVSPRDPVRRSGEEAAWRREGAPPALDEGDGEVAGGQRRSAAVQTCANACRQRPGGKATAGASKGGGDESD